MKEKRGILWWDETGKWIIGIALLVVVIIALIVVFGPKLIEEIKNFLSQLG